MTFHILRVALGADPEPPSSQRRVLVSHTRWVEGTPDLVEDEWGAVMRYDRRDHRGFDRAQQAARDWAAAQALTVENLYIEVDPEA